MAEERPAPRGPSGPPVPEPRLTPTEMEAVITRAIELQAREEERTGDEGIGAQELIRIAGELGLAPSHVQQAIAEVRGAPPPETGALTTLVGDARVTVSRFLPMPAATARQQLDRYLQDREAMIALRRLPDRVIYERGAGVGAAVARAAGMVGGRHPLLNLKTLEVTVNQADERTCFVALSVDLHSQRSGHAVGMAVGGLTTTAAAAGVAILVAPPLALVGLPVLGGFTYLLRSAYRATLAKTRVQLESLLDRLEHKELIEPGPAASLLKRFGL